LHGFDDASPASTWSARSSGRDFAFPGSPASSAASSGSTLRRSNLCSNLSFDMSSSVFFFQSSSSKTLFCSEAIWPQRYCTHWAREAACFAATSAWKAAQVALAAWMLLRSWPTASSPAAGHGLASSGAPSASARGLSAASGASMAVSVGDLNSPLPQHWLLSS